MKNFLEDLKLIDKMYDKKGNLTIKKVMEYVRKRKMNDTEKVVEKILTSDARTKHSERNC